jgi:formyltetrahydrofolate-dependent phosphoribosylglycinamide formyltransferase/phosphoribosylaminoimidazole-succinocarboxamide synthase
MKNIAVFASGNGTNYDAIVNATKNNILPNINKIYLICNNKSAPVISKAIVHDLPYKVFIMSKYSDETKYETEKKYYQYIFDYIKLLNIELIVLAGWMSIIPQSFLNSLCDIDCRIINIHPALPGAFPGANAIKRTYQAYRKGLVTHGGIMIHHVIDEVDAGSVIATKMIPIYNSDMFETFKNRLQQSEKILLIYAIDNLLNNTSISTIQYRTKDIENLNTKLMSSGKVSENYVVTYNQIEIPFMITYRTDRLTAFNKHLTNIKGKGHIVSMQNLWWLDKTKHIMPNHKIVGTDNTMLCKKCTPIKLKFTVRGYLTEPLYNIYIRGQRTFDGYELKDGLSMNQKLDSLVLNITTKDNDDKIINVKDALQRMLITQKEYDYIKNKAFELYEFGHHVSYINGFILADAIYQFGYDVFGNILLIDDIHTSDCSRFLSLETKESYDQDIIRNWLNQNKYSKTLEKDLENSKINELLIHRYCQLYNKITSHERDDELTPNDLKESYKPNVFMAREPCYNEHESFKSKLRIVSYLNEYYPF